jgi:hypothetical protein
VQLLLELPPSVSLLPVQIVYEPVGVGENLQRTRDNKSDTTQETHSPEPSLAEPSTSAPLVRQRSDAESATELGTYGIERGVGEPLLLGRTPEKTCRCNRTRHQLFQVGVGENLQRTRAVEAVTT